MSSVVLLHLLQGRRTGVTEDFWSTRLFTLLALALYILEVLPLYITDLCLPRPYGFKQDFSLISPS